MLCQKGELHNPFSVQYCIQAPVWHLPCLQLLTVCINSSQHITFRSMCHRQEHNHKRRLLSYYVLGLLADAIPTINKGKLFCSSVEFLSVVCHEVIFVS